MLKAVLSLLASWGACGLVKGTQGWAGSAGEQKTEVWIAALLAIFLSLESFLVFKLIYFPVAVPVEYISYS